MVIGIYLILPSRSKLCKKAIETQFIIIRFIEIRWFETNEIWFTTQLSYIPCKRVNGYVTGIIK